MSDQQPTALRSIIGNRLVQLLAGVAALLAIATEGLALYRSYIAVGIETANRTRAEAEAALAKAQSESSLRPVDMRAAMEDQLKRAGIPFDKSTLKRAPSPRSDDH